MLKTNCIPLSALEFLPNFASESNYTYKLYNRNEREKKKHNTLVGQRKLTMRETRYYCWLHLIFLQYRLEDWLRQTAFGCAVINFANNETLFFEEKISNFRAKKSRKFSEKITTRNVGFSSFPFSGRDLEDINLFFLLE